MGADEPAKVHEFLFAAWADRNLEAIMALYETDATLASDPASALHGVDEIREWWDQVLDGFAELTIKADTAVLGTGRIAMVSSRWTLEGNNADGLDISLDGTGIDVVRQQPDGDWKIAIDNPWGELLATEAEPSR